MLLNTILLLSAAAIEPIITGFETEDMKVSEGSKTLWDHMWSHQLISNQDLEFVYANGHLPGGTVVKDSPLAADRQQAWGTLAEAKIVTGEELAQMLMGGKVEGMTAKEIGAFESLAPVYEPDAAKRLNYDVRRKHIVCDMIRRSKKAKKEIEKRRARVEAEAERQGIPVTYSDGKGHASVITDFDENGMPNFLITHNATASIHLHTTDVRPEGDSPFNLTGEGMLAGLWDPVEIRDTHQEFASNQVEQIDDPGYSLDKIHATAVAATMGATGAVASAKGMAPGLGVKAWDADGFVSSFPDAVIDYPALQLSAHPYGSIAGWYDNSAGAGQYWWRGSSTNSSVVPYFGTYTYASSDRDELLYDAPYRLAVFSSGDEYGEEYNGEEHYCYYHGTWTNDYHPADGAGTSGYDTLNEYATVKNGLVIGTVTASGPTNGPWTYAVHTNSSRGPTDDGRIKPDLVACTPTVYTASGSSDSSYSSSMGGSSFAAGAVAASTTLLQKQHETYYGTNSPLLGSTYKAFLITKAVDIGLTGPDYDTGYGLLHTENTAWAISNNAAAFDSLPYIKEVRLDGTPSGSTASWIFKVYSPYARPTLTAVWADPEGPRRINTPHNDTNSVLVNNIDLRVYGPHGEGDYMGGPTNYPWVLDPANPSAAATRGDNFRDNVEQVQVPISSGTGEWYTAVLTYEGTLTNGYQDVSVASSGTVWPQTGPVFEFTGAAGVGTNGQVSLVWTGVVGAAYQVLETPDLTASNLVWSEVDTVTPNHEGTVNWTNDTAMTSNMFYRMKRLR